MKWAEAIVVAAAGGILGGELLALFDLYWFGAVPAGVAGAISGYRQIYDWKELKGSLAFLLDSTWGLVLTAGGVLIHLANFASHTADYRPELSIRQNRHVYGGGVAVKRGYAWTVGNVTTNADTSRLDDPSQLERRLQFLRRHEDRHIWQSRLLGPFFPILYLGWMAIGAVVAVGIWAVRRGSLGKTIETIAYYDNPFEYMAYVADERWPHPDADPGLSWPGPKTPHGPV